MPDIVIPENRRLEILNLVKRNGIVTTSMLAKQFKVSTETVRKDLLQLEKEGIVIRKHGGAVINKDNFNIPIREKINYNTDNKQKIAEKIIDLIPNNSTVFIGAGSTELYIAQELIIQKKINIITNSILIASLMDDIDCRETSIVLLGGSVEPKSLSTTGIWTLNQIESNNYDYSILGTSGFKNMNGPGIFSYDELAVLESVINKSNCNIVIGDYTKFYKSSAYEFAEWKDIDIFVTDFDSSKNQYNDNSLLEKLHSLVKVIKTT